MRLEVNADAIEENHTLRYDAIVLMITPSIDEDYWMMRVRLTESQAVVAFPKFTTYGIGFQREEDWNTNLPYTCASQEIFDHIAHNKGDEGIKDSDVIQAIEMLQSGLAEYLNERQQD